ncbi:hypothetical protein BBP40_008697, partial [Aspergillus hancockii]
MQISLTFLASLLVLSSTAAAIDSAVALGINCRGSGGCAGSGAAGGQGTRLSQIKKQIDKVDNNRHFNNGEHIACIENKLGTGICAFFQNTSGGGSGADAKRLIQDLINHGCTACGSVPTNPGVISRGQATIPPGTKPEASTFLQVGVFQNALLRLKDYYGTPDATCAQADWNEYLADSTQSVTPWLLDPAQDTQYPLDRFSDANGLLYQYQATRNETYKKVLGALRQSIDLQSRNKYGGYWYFKYPNWSYLDGMYSLIPFYSTYTTKFASANRTAVAKDLVYQLDLLWSHCRQNSSGLLVHGYDASKTAVWANPVTGASPIVWIRSLGWYGMALVDILELSRPQGVLSQDQWSHIHQRFIALSNAIIAAADPDTGCWWQVMTDAKREGNYIESSGSAMFTYALYKGARLGYLKGHFGSNLRPADIASKCYRHLVQDFVVDNKNGTLGYNGTVAVCSLNSTATYESLTNLTFVFVSHSLLQTVAHFRWQNFVHFPHGLSKTIAMQLTRLSAVLLLSGAYAAYAPQGPPPAAESVTTTEIPGGCNPAHPGSCPTPTEIPGGCNPAHPGSCPESTEIP